MSAAGSSSSLHPFIPAMRSGRSCPCPRCQPGAECLARLSRELPEAAQPAARILPPPKSHNAHLGRPRSPIHLPGQSHCFSCPAQPGRRAGFLGLRAVPAGSAFLSVCPQGFKCTAAPGSSCCCAPAASGWAMPALSLPRAGDGDGTAPPGWQCRATAPPAATVNIYYVIIKY